jgi:hypothetical protein
MFAALSIFQQDFGMYDHGSATCPKCKTFLHLTFLPDKKEFAAEPYDDFVKRIKEKLKKE